MGKIKLGVGLTAGLFLGYLFATPYITAYQMKKAAEHHDGEALSEHVDFPAVRQSIKDQLNAMIGKEMVQEGDENPLATLGAAFGSLMIDKMVDAYITPAGITVLMKGEKPSSRRSGGGKSTGARSGGPFANMSMSYNSISKFSITVRDDDLDEDVKFILRRQGIGWKLTEIIILK